MTIEQRESKSYLTFPPHSFEHFHFRIKEGVDNSEKWTALLFNNLNHSICVKCLKYKLGLGRERIINIDPKDLLALISQKVSQIHIRSMAISKNGSDLKLLIPTLGIIELKKEKWMARVSPPLALRVAHGTYKRLHLSAITIAPRDLILDMNELISKGSYKKVKAAVTIEGSPLVRYKPSGSIKDRFESFSHEVETYKIIPPGTRGLSHAVYICHYQNKARIYAKRYFSDYFAMQDVIPENLKIRFFTMLAEGVHSLHTLGRSHGDIKTENILVDKEFSEAVFTDYGLSRPLNDPIKHNFGTAGFLSPETLASRLFGIIPDYDLIPVDVYAFGLTLHEAFFGPHIITQHQVKNEFAESIIAMRLLNSSASPQGNSILRVIWSCLRFDPKARISFPEITSALKNLDKTRKNDKSDK